jgi:hypothetical protein
MKSGIIISFFFAGAALAVPAAPPKTLQEVAPLMKPSKVISDKPLIRSTAKRSKALFGPFVIPASKVRTMIILENNY